MLQLPISWGSGEIKPSIVIKKIFSSLVVIMSVLTCKVSYGVQIVCDTDVSNSQNQLRIVPNDDVYAFSKIDLAGGFRLAGTSDCVGQ